MAGDKPESTSNPLVSPSSERPATGSCFFWHEWGAWHQVVTTGTKLMSDSSWRKTEMIYQRRFCQRCNKMQLEKII